MRVLTIHNCHYIKGGACYIYIMTNELLKRNGHEVIPFSVNSINNIETVYAKYFLSDIENVNIFKKTMKRLSRTLYSFEAKKKIQRLINECSPDIAHLHNIYGRISLSILDVLRREGIPVIQTLHDYKLICPVFSLLSKGNICEDCKFTRYYNCLLKNCSPYTNSLLKSAIHMLEAYLNKYILHYEDKVDCFISPSRFLKEKMIEFGLPQEKIVHIPNFIHIDKYKPNFDFDNYLVCFGRLSHEKGIDILIKAMQGISGIDLLIVGDGPDYKNYIKLVENMEIKNITFLGYRSGDDLHELVRNAMFSVIPSMWYENNPISVIESFALGTPVIGTDIGGIPELIDEREDGLLCEPGSVEDLREKIIHLINNKRIIKKMGKNAREKAEKKYSSIIYYERIKNFYNEIITG